MTLCASAALHVAVTALLASAPRTRPAADVPLILPAARSTGAADEPAGLPVVEQGISIVDEPAAPVEPPRSLSAGDTVARTDTGSPGHGGDEVDRAAALNLADADERMRLSPDLLSRLDRDQLQRLRVARERASWEDRRSTTHPAELTFVAIGSGVVHERRPRAERDPSRGALASPDATAAGGLLGASADDADGDDGLLAATHRGGSTAGAFEAFPGVGVREGPSGADHRASAFVASARPSITNGPVAVPAPARARPRDDVDSQQEVATTVRALVHASTAGGAAGEGEGGSGGGGDPGAEGSRGARSAARPLGAGEGDVYDFFTSDPRLVPYFRRMHARLDPLWANAFPKSALIDLKQGVVILDFTVFADGRVAVAWPPERPSGIDEFDRNSADAIRRAAPFEPIPRELGVARLQIRAPFVANNPIVK